MIGFLRAPGGGEFQTYDLTTKINDLLPSCGSYDKMSVCIPQTSASISKVHECNTTVDTSLYFVYPSSQCSGDPCYKIDQVVDVFIDQTFDLMLSFTMTASDSN